MILVLNGESLEVADNLSAHDLVVQLGYENQRIALEINEAIIAKSCHVEFTLNEGDKVEVIKAVGGG